MTIWLCLASRSPETIGRGSKLSSIGKIDTHNFSGKNYIAVTLQGHRNAIKSPLCLFILQCSITAREDYRKPIIAETLWAQEPWAEKEKCCIILPPENSDQISRDRNG